MEAVDVLGVLQDFLATTDPEDFGAAPDRPTAPAIEDEASEDPVPDAK